MQSRLVSLLLVASLVVPWSRARAQACIAGARPMFLTGPRGDSIEIDEPSLVALKNGVMIAGMGAVTLKDGKVFLEAPLRIARVRGDSTVAIDLPAGFGRFYSPRLANDPSGAIHLLWAEADTTESLPSEPPPLYDIGRHPRVLWGATYRRGRWSTPVRLGQLDGMAWRDYTPTRASVPHPAIAAVGHVGRAEGYVNLYFADAEGWRIRSLNVGGPPVYASLAPTKNGLMLAYIAASSGGEQRNRNTVFITDSLATDAAWSRPVALGVRGDQAATRVSLLPGNDGTVNAVWGQSLTDRLDADVVRIVPLDERGRPRSPAQDLAGFGPLTHLHGESDARGGAHVVFQRVLDDSPKAYYAHWSPRLGWGTPVLLSDSPHSRAPAIVASAGDSLSITYSAYIGMSGPIPRFATAIVRVGTGAVCAR